MSLALLHARAQVLELARYPAFAVPTVGFPVLLYIFFGLTAEPAEPTMAAFAAFAVLSVAFFEFGVGIAHDRASPWDRFLRTLPLPPATRLASRGLAAIPFAAAAAGAVLLAGTLIGSADLRAASWAALLLALFLGGIPHCLLGISIGYWARPKAALPLANALFLGLSFAGGLWLSPEHLPATVEVVSPFLPTRQWGELLWASIDLDADAAAGALAWLAGYTVVFGGFAAWGYRRDEGERYE
jgi:ABC-2 type transport system permease protein